MNEEEGPQKKNIPITKNNSISFLTLLGNTESLLILLAKNPRGMKLGILTEREGRSTLGALPEIPSRVREMERRVGHLGLGCLSV